MSDWPKTGNFVQLQQFKKLIVQANKKIYRQVKNTEKIMRFVICLISVYFVFISGVFASEEVSLTETFQRTAEKEKINLADAVEKALNNNPQIKKALHNIESLRADRKDAFSGFMPEISTYIEYSAGDSPSSYLFKKIDQRKLPGNVNFNDPGRFDNIEAGITAKIRLFNGGRTLRSGRMAEKGVESGKLMADEIRNDIVFAVSSAWYDMLSAKDMTEVAKESVDALKKQVRIAEIKLRGGSLLRSDLLSLKARLSSSEESLLQAKNRLEIIKSELASIMGFDPGIKIDFSDDSEFLMKDLPSDYHQGFVEAVEKRPFYKAVEKQTEIAQLKKKVRKGGYLPTLDFKADYYHDDPDFEFSRERQNWRAGMVLGWKLFSGFSTQAGVEKAEAEAGEAYETRRKVLLDIKTEVRKAFLNMELAEKRLKSAKMQKQYALSSFELVKEQFEGGSADITRYLEAELAASRAKKAQTNAFYNKKKAKAAAARAVGLLYSEVD
jgi:outer membrane protein TolC